MDIKNPSKFRAPPPESGLKEPIRKFSETFNAEKAIVKKFFSEETKS